ncbi:MULTISPECIES: lysophospholipid acyltransferase family protein [Roseobacteraceae]|uniref:Acyltransferase domain-containing protein n=1 Tax=Celeribacter baekdonensis B30 TaxID=1208323 RepID=K2JQZ0_9RHOB|nr:MULTISPECIES: lysophospholipid acyltransferase family protein [Roseobacteraceae]EKE72874.1 acyltransferase domain-containing protein [Celeribacter baekdonensis B30]KAB6717879.1 acyltransferase [Roseobacter sp. TSBP12]|tara:strand:- start:5863 stop:6819 length:957 start_codon:yes stop_codon:yes gene_type:complete
MQEQLRHSPTAKWQKAKWSERQVARDISYASSAGTRTGRVLIRLMENATGRLSLIRRAKGYNLDVAEGRDFWAVMVERYGLELEVINGALDAIPATGPLIIVANHPYGILDGLMLGHILSVVRGDFRILAHSVFKRAEDIDRVILPVSFEETKEAVALNLATRKEALSYLDAGGCIGIFPGGTVSTAARPMGRPMDPGWRAFTAKMVAKSGATVVPLYFDGANSRLFQLASHLHTTLRMGLLIREFRAKIGAPVRVSVGAPIGPEKLAQFKGDPKKLMDFLRAETYALSSTPMPNPALGYEFEIKHGAKPRKGLKDRY